MPKRSAEEEKIHLLKKIRRLERKIVKLPDTDNEANDDLEEGQIIDKENEPPPEEDILESFVEEERRESPEEWEGTLEEEVLDILGSAPARQPTKESLHNQIADRWNEILDKGLKKEEKENITKENPTFTNIPKMLTPKLNKEVSAALNENAKRRDQVIENRQKQISTALACLGQALQMCLGDIKEQKLGIIKKVNESGRLLCDSLFLESKGRRALVLSTINKDLKDSLLETEIGEYLFGENLTEKIRTAKAVQKSGKDLKTQSEEKKKNLTKRPEINDRKDNYRTLNWRGPPRGGIQQRPQRAGGPTYNRQQTLKRNEDRGAPRRNKK